MRDGLPEYKIIRSRRRTLGLQVKEDGVVVRAPYWTGEAAIRRFVGAHLDWIEKQEAKWARVRAETAAAPRLTEEDLKMLKKEAKQDLSARAAHFAQWMGVSYGRISVRAMRSRWGSCSREGNLSFNCLLMLAPPEVRDATVIHELCHRKHMDHSPAFWKEVERFCPDYKNSSRWLKAHGPALIARLPGNPRG